METVECNSHGPQPGTFVCQHLAESLRGGNRVGYYCSGENPDNPRPDAWCARCEEKRLQCSSDWNDESESFAGITLLCGFCYDAARTLNKV